MSQLLEAYVGLEYLVGNISAHEKYYMCHTAVQDPASCNITKECQSCTNNTNKCHIYWQNYCSLSSNITTILSLLQDLKMMHLLQVSTI